MKLASNLWLSARENHDRDFLQGPRSFTASERAHVKFNEFRFQRYLTL